MRWDYRLRSVASGGESLGAELLAWGREAFGLTINEFYGQTECNMIVSSCAALMEPRVGFMGRAVPGHQLAIVDENGDAMADGQLGNIAVKRPDPVMFLRYWDAPEATERKFRGDWLITGDMGVRQEDGFIRFVGRDDDVITSAGYRIGPGEIEDCLLGHPAVEMAGVVGVPDPARTEIVKAFIVLARWFRAVRRTDPGHPAPRQGAARGARVSARDRVRALPADDDDRQDHPSRASGASSSLTSIAVWRSPRVFAEISRRASAGVGGIRLESREEEILSTRARGASRSGYAVTLAGDRRKIQ